MRNTKRIAALLCSLSLMALAACAVQPGEVEQSIQPARLTQEEQDIVQLLGMGDDSLIYDFELDGTAQSVEICAYQLLDGGWQPLTSGARQLTGTEGRLALRFEIIGDGVCTSVQSGHHGSSDSWSSPEPVQGEELGWHTAVRSDRTEIAYEQEIPLVVQFGGSGSAVPSFGVDGFFTPGDYTGCEYAYAITVRFSQKTVDELEPGLT